MLCIIIHRVCSLKYFENKFYKCPAGGLTAAKTDYLCLITDITEH